MAYTMIKRNKAITDLFMDICMDLWAGDVTISYERFIKEIQERIENLESYIGEDAHKRLESMGIEDNTGMSWEEQDKQTEKQISEYKELLIFLENDNNWTW